MEASAGKVLSNYIEARQAEFDKLELSEKAIELEIGDGVSVSGRIDLVRRRDTNEIAIVDLKSSDRAQAEDLTDAQLHIYALGYRELTGKNADFVETYLLEEQKRRSRAVDEDFIDDVRKRIRAAATAIRTSKFPQRPTPSKCGKCDFCRLC